VRCAVLNAELRIDLLKVFSFRTEINLRISPSPYLESGHRGSPFVGVESEIRGGSQDASLKQNHPHQQRLFVSGQSLPKNRETSR
jgi:hypothetical protein